MTIVDIELFNKMREVLGDPSVFNAAYLKTQDYESEKLTVAVDSEMLVGIQITDKMGVAPSGDDYMSALSLLTKGVPQLIEEEVRNWDMHEVPIGVTVRLILSRVKSPHVVGITPISSVWLVEEVLSETHSGFNSSTLTKLADDLHRKLVVLDGLELKKAVDSNIRVMTERTLLMMNTSETTEGSGQ